MICKRIIFRLLILSLSILPRTGEGSKELNFETLDISPQTLKEGYITVTLKYLNEELLMERFGKEANPFIAPPSALKLNRFFIFELTISVEDTVSSLKYDGVTLQLNKVEMQFGGKYENPTNQFHLESFWEMRINKDDRYTGWNEGKVSRIVKTNVLPNSKRIESHSRSSGLLVFIGNFPDYGNALVYVPVFDGKGGMIKNFAFSFEF